MAIDASGEGPFANLVPHPGYPDTKIALAEVSEPRDATVFREISEALRTEFFDIPRGSKAMEPGQDPAPLWKLENQGGERCRVDGEEADRSDTSIPPILCHYTSLDGFMGILNSRSLFLTNLMAVNDAHEIFGLFDTVEGLFANAASSSTVTDEEKLFLEFVVARMRVYGRGEPPRSFVCSLTSDYDSTLHWQAYGHANGVSLNFDTHRLRYELSGLRNHHLFKCVYDEKQRQRILLRMFSLLRGAFEKFLNKVDFYGSVEERRDWLVRAHAIMFTYAQFFGMIKTPEFSHEHEWRIVYYRPFTPERREVEPYRHRNGYLATRYVLALGRRRADFFRNGLKSILIGPSPHSSRHQQMSTHFTVRQVLRDAGLGHVEVTLSDSPLRATI